MYSDKELVQPSRNLNSCSRSENLKRTKNKRDKNGRVAATCDDIENVVREHSLVRARRPTYRDFGIMTCSFVRSSSVSSSPESSESTRLLAWHHAEWTNLGGGSGHTRPKREVLKVHPMNFWPNVVSFLAFVYRTTPISQRGSIAPPRHGPGRSPDFSHYVIGIPIRDF